MANVNFLLSNLFTDNCRIDFAESCQGILAILFKQPNLSAKTNFETLIQHNIDILIGSVNTDLDRGQSNASSDGTKHTSQQNTLAND